MDYLEIKPELRLKYRVSKKANNKLNNLFSKYINECFLPIWENKIKFNNHKNLPNSLRCLIGEQNQWSLAICEKVAEK